jgi:hypothetical protein
MKDELKSVIKKFVLVYLDDVIIYSKTLKQHIVHKEKVLELLRKAGLKIEISKCTFFQTSVNYLGHVISQTGITPDYKKTKVIESFPTPTNIRYLKSFLGLAGSHTEHKPILDV